MTRVLVTGGAGFIGSALVRRLVAAGRQVVVLDNFSRAGESPGAGEVIRGDIRSERDVDRAMRGCDQVIHLAAVNGTRTFYEQPKRVIDTAIRGTLNVLDACLRHGVRDLMLVSSSEVYQTAEVPAAEDVPLSVPDPLNPRYSYGGGKIAAELMAIASVHAGDLDRLIIARPHNCYGTEAGREHVIPEFCLRMARLAEKYPDGVIPFVIEGDGNQSRAFCHVSDCTDALMLLLDKAPQGTGIWHVGNDEEISVEALAHLIGEHYRRPVKVLPGPPAEGGTLRRCPDISKLRALGYEPKVPLTDGIGPVIDWYREHPHGLHH